MFFSMTMFYVAVGLYSAEIIGFDGIIISVIAEVSSFGPVIALANLGSSLASTFATGNRVLDILDEKPVVEENTSGKSIAFSGAACEKVDFSYDSEKVLSGFSMEIPQDQIIGVTGKSGSGKSTLLRLLMRFWDPDEGKVTVSGIDAKEIRTGSLRDSQSFVTQQTQIFRESV